MGLVKIWQRFELLGDDGKPVAFEGQLSDAEPRTISVTNADQLNKRFSLATTGNEKIYDASIDLPATWVFGWLTNLSLTDAMDVELVVANGGSQTMQTFVIAPTMTHVFSSQVGRQSDHVEGWGTVGTLDTIDTINVYNRSASIVVPGSLYLTD